MERTLVSYVLCPYAQRISISLMEKGVDFTRVNIDLSDKPDWFRTISPLGKVPLLKISDEEGETILFESSAILEYLEDSLPNPLHPSDPLSRARNRSWIEFGSSLLNDIAGFYSAKTESAFLAKIDAMGDKMARLESELSAGPWFGGENFSLVDVVYGPVFRYFDLFDTIDDFGLFQDKPNIRRWRDRLSERVSVKKAVSPEYPELLSKFLVKKQSYLSDLMKG